MTVDQHLSRIERENGLVFAVKWSLVGVALAACVLASGCGTFFETGPERYNTVQGPRRTPLLNPGGASQPQQTGEQQQQNQSQQQPPNRTQPQAAQVQPGRQPVPPMQQQGRGMPPQTQPMPQSMRQPVTMQQQAASQDTVPPQNTVSAMPPAPSASQFQSAQRPAAQQPAVQPDWQAQRAEQPANPFAGQPQNTTPALPPTPPRNPAQQPNAPGVEAEITAMEQEYSRSQMKRQEMRQAQEDEGWLPTIDLDSWMNGAAQEEGAGAVAADQPAQQPVNVERSAPGGEAGGQANTPASASANTQDAKVVSVPALHMDKNGTQVRYGQADAYAPPQTAAQPATAPGADTSPPEPPMITQPATQPVEQMAQSAPRTPQEPQSLEVPNPPSVRPASQSLSPEGLVPPRPAYSGAQTNYLDDSRYAVRRGYSHRGSAY